MPARFARQVVAKDSALPTIVERPYSLFDFIEQNFGGLDTLRRTISQARSHDVKTMVVEQLRSCEELEEENQDIQTRLNRAFESQAYRLSFFSSKFSSCSEIDKVREDDFIGYAIVKEDRDIPKISSPFHIYESVFKKSPFSHNFIRGEQEYECRVGGRSFKVRGYLFAQQNGITNVCAHAALRTVAARFLPNCDLSYRAINQMVGIDHKNKFAKDGLNSTQIRDVLRANGINAFQADFATGEEKSPTSFQRFLYTHIESGYPSIVFFRVRNAPKPGSCHVVSVFGHTFNQDSWVHKADRVYFSDSRKIGPRLQEETRYASSDSWLSMFIGHDDNVGANLCIPQHYLQTKWCPVPNPRRDANGEPETVDLNSVCHVISTLGPKVVLTPILAELTAARHLLKHFAAASAQGLTLSQWLNRFYRLARAGEFVLRPMLINGRQYVSHLNRLHDWSPGKVGRDVLRQIGTAVQDHHVWMIEISVPEIFSTSKRKVGELLLRADIGNDPKGELPADRRFFLLARLPGYYFFLKPTVKAGSKDLFTHIPSGIKDHTQVFGAEDSDPSVSQPASRQM